GTARLLAQGPAELPGLRERLLGLVLPAAATITGGLAQSEVIAAHPDNVLITRLPTAAVAASPTRPHATHLLWRHRAHAIGTGLALPPGGTPVGLSTTGNADAAIRLERDGTRLRLKTAAADVEIEGDGADLRAGDRLRIGGEVL